MCPASLGVAGNDRKSCLLAGRARDQSVGGLWSASDTVWSLPVLPGEAPGGGETCLHPLLQHKPQGDAAGWENDEHLLQQNLRLLP